MRISFRATLLTLMLGVLLTAVALLGTAAYLYARFAIQDLGSQVLTQASERVEQHVQHALDVAEDEAETIAALIKQDWFHPEDQENVSTYFLAALAARPSLSYLSFGMPSGQYYHAFRNRDGGLSVLQLTPQDDGSRRLFEFNILPGDGTREVVRDIPKSKRTPPYERPYYRAAREAGEAVWTESYVFLGSGESLDVPGVSRAVPVADPENDTFVGVLTADFDLHALSRFLRDVTLGSEGFCFLVEMASDGTHRIIAHPAAADPDPAKRLDLTEPSPDGEGRVTVRSNEIAEPRVVKFLDVLDRDITPEATELERVQFEADGRTYVGGFRHLGRDGGPDWIIAMLLPEDEVFGDVQRMARLMVYLGISGVLMAAALSVLLSKRIAGYLGAIAAETREIGQFRLEPKPLIQSRIREIATLATAVEEMKTGLRSFQKYVPADLVRSLLESGEEAKLGGARTEITVYFSDLVGFTSLSERLPPEELVALLARYLDEMTGEILRNRGTVDKFMGDAIMAFWGAPHPHDGDALAASRSALANRAKLAELREEWTRAGLPPLHARIGIHTGTATVGNFGSPSRLDYTAIGDTVNVASRLEGLNQIFGTEILISEVTQAAVADVMLTRPIDRVAVRGRHQGMMIYELIGNAGTVSALDRDCAAMYATALERYFDGDWADARRGFATVLDLKPDDAAARIILERCETYQDAPPPPNWDGVFQAPK